jgi:hypothetical protein
MTVVRNILGSMTMGDEPLYVKRGIIEMPIGSVLSMLFYIVGTNMAKIPTFEVTFSERTESRSIYLFLYYGITRRF